MSQSNGRKTIFFGNRKHMNRAFKIIAWLTVLSMIAGYGIFSIKELVTGRVNAEVANVNGLSVPVEEFRRNYTALHNFISMAKSEYGKNADMILQLWGIDAQKKAEDVVLEKLIEEKVIQSWSDSFGMKVGKDYLDAKLQDAQFMRNFIPGEIFQGGRLNLKLLSEYLQQQNMNLDDFENQVKESIRKSVLSEALDGVGYITDAALKDEFLKKYAKRKYSLISVGLDEYLKEVNEKGITEKELERYFKDHQESYRVPEKRQANFWVFDPNAYDIVVEEKEIADFFEKNKNLYRRDDALTEEPSYKNLSEVRQEIIDKVKSNKFTKQFGVDINRVLIESKQSPAAFFNYVTNKKGEILPPMSLMLDNSKQSQKIFELSKIKDKAFFIENGKGYVGELIKIERSYIPALKDIANKVKQDLVKQKAHELAEQAFVRLAKDKQKTMEEIRSIINGKLIKTDILDPQDSKTYKGLEERGLRKDVLFNLEAIKQRTTLVADSTGFIIQLDEIIPLDSELFEKKKDDLRANARKVQARYIFSDLLKHLQTKAVVKINHDLIAQVLLRR